MGRVISEQRKEFFCTESCGPKSSEQLELAEGGHARKQHGTSGAHEHHGGWRFCGADKAGAAKRPDAVGPQNIAQTIHDRPPGKERSVDAAVLSARLSRRTRYPWHSTKAKCEQGPWPGTEDDGEFVVIFSAADGQRAPDALRCADAHNEGDSSSSRYLSDRARARRHQDASGGPSRRRRPSRRGLHGEAPRMRLSRRPQNRRPCLREGHVQLGPGGGGSCGGVRHRGDDWRERR
jgi:hypothetical protein